MYEKNANGCEGVKETFSPLSMGLMIKSENLTRLRDVLSSLSYSCSILGIKDEYLVKEESPLKKDDDVTFIDKDERIYQEQQKILYRIEYLSKQLSEFVNM